MLPVLKSDLSRSNLQFLRDGTFGDVYKTSYKLHGDRTELAYKEYKTSVPGGGRPKSGATAEKAVSFRDVLRVGRDVLDTYFAWPREVVMNDATTEICGFLMPLAQQDFFWPEGKPVNLPRTLDWLTMPETFWRVNGLDKYWPDVNETDRLFLMTQLAYAVHWLHERGWVFGDLSFTNAAFALKPPRLMLFDCDDAADLADPQRELQPHSPNWIPPECQGAQPQEQDSITDVYKLGLAIVRCLKPETGATTTFDVSRLTGILDPVGLDLLTRALSTDRGGRPSAGDLFLYLERITRPRMVPPQIMEAEVLIPLVIRGANARVSWYIENAEEIEVFVGDKQQQLVRRVIPTGPWDQCAFPVTQPGQVTVAAGNRYGSATRVIGDVAPFEISPFSLDLGKLSRPDIPPIPDYATQSIPAPPGVPPAAPDIPSAPRFEFAELLGELAPGGTITSPGAHINMVLDTSRSLLDLIHAETDHFIAMRPMRRRKNG